MRRRFFISIDLPEEVRETLARSVKKWLWLPIRWLPESNWHITIIPPFYADEKEFLEVKITLEKIAKRLEPFELRFDSIILAPPGKKARMIWFSGSANKRLQEIKEKIEDEFIEGKIIPSFKREERAVATHATLARFEEGGLQELEQKTHTLEKLNLAFMVRAVYITESHLKPSGAEYETIETIALGAETLKEPF